jgi:conjugal transfer pilus assembly protein TraD
MSASNAQVFQFQNPFREIIEFYAISGWVAAAVLTFALDASAHVHSNVFLAFALFCLFAAAYRTYQAMELWDMQKHLQGVPLSFMTREELKAHMVGHESDLFLGFAFEWTQQHVQLVHDIRRIDPSRLRAPGKDEMGQRWVHGLGMAQETKLFLPLDHTAGHLLLVGTTRSGKSRILDIIISQAVARGETVIVWDPKNDKGLVESLQHALVDNGHDADELVYFNPAFPEKSWRIDPLANFVTATELASRIAALIPSETGADPFTAHSMMVLTNLCEGLLMINMKPSLKLLKRFVDSGPEWLLVRACEAYFTKNMPDWEQQAQEFLRRAKGRNDREKAIAYDNFYAEIVQAKFPSTALEGLFSDFTHDTQHQQKMTASLTPVLTMLTAGALGDMLSPDDENYKDDRHITNFSAIIRNRQACYIGLNTLSDNMVGSAIGSMFVSDMTAVSGDRYNYGQKLRPVTLIIDEAAELISDKLIQLLNKAGGSLVRLVVATQTFADFAARVGSADKAEMILGNLNNKIILRTINAGTQKYLVESFPETYVRHIEYTQATDARTDNLMGFGYRLSEAMKETQVPYISADVLGCIPNLEFIADISGGRIFKGRIPILGTDNRLPDKEST